jgi:hypothetical protein
MSRLESAPRASRRRFLAGIAALSLVALPPSAAASDDAPGFGALMGTYRHVGGEAERQAVHDAIEEVVRELSPLARPIARARLEEANPIPGRLALSSDGKRVTTTFAAESFTASLDGTPAKVVTSAGDEMVLRLRHERGTLRQGFSAPGKARTNWIRIEGGKLVIYVRVVAEALPRELVYRLTYERVE